MNKDLVSDLAVATAIETGLPKEMVDGELLRLLELAGLERGNLTLDQLREVLAEYLQDVLLAAKEELSPSST